MNFETIPKSDRELIGHGLILLAEQFRKYASETNPKDALKTDLERYHKMASRCDQLAHSCFRKTPS